MGITPNTITLDGAILISTIGLKKKKSKKKSIKKLKLKLKK